jgi:hypothetical protein
MVTNPSEEVVPLSEHNVLIESLSNMMLTTIQADQTVQEKTNRLIQQFQVSMQELQRQNELLMQRNEQLETQVVTLEGRVRDLDSLRHAELWSLGVNPDRFKDVNELVKAIIAAIPNYAYLQAETQKVGRYVVWNMLLHLGAGNRPEGPLNTRKSFWWLSHKTAPVRPTAGVDKILDYKQLLDQLYPRMKHLSSRELAEPLKIIYGEPFTHWGGWDVEITVLTSETIQKIREFENNS